jgi:hypothetical protein
MSGIPGCTGIEPDCSPERVAGKVSDSIAESGINVLIPLSGLEFLISNGIDIKVLPGHSVRDVVDDTTASLGKAAPELQATSNMPEFNLPALVEGFCRSSGFPPGWSSL